MILPTNNQSQNNDTSPSTINLTNDFKNTSIVTSKQVSASDVPTPGVKLDTKKISMKEDFMCSKEELYRALTDKNVSR